MKNLSTKIGQVITGAVIFVLSINFASAQKEDAAKKADCACMEFPGMKVVIDECELSFGFCVGSCLWKSVDNPNVVVASGRLCDKVGGAGGDGTDKKVSLYDINSNLNVAIGKPVAQPNSVSVNLEITGTSSTMMKYDIINSLGETIATKYVLSAGISELKIDTKALAKGIYSLKFEINGQIVNRTFNV